MIRDPNSFLTTYGLQLRLKTRGTKQNIVFNTRMDETVTNYLVAHVLQESGAQYFHNQKGKELFIRATFASAYHFDNTNDAAEAMVAWFTTPRLGEFIEDYLEGRVQRRLYEANKKVDTLEAAEVIMEQVSGNPAGLHKIMRLGYS
jgi:hypothetical protein